MRQASSLLLATHLSHSISSPATATSASAAALPLSAQHMPCSDESKATLVLRRAPSTTRSCNPLRSQTAGFSARDISRLYCYTRSLCAKPRLPTSAFISAPAQGALRATQNPGELQYSLADENKLQRALHPIRASPWHQNVAALPNSASAATRPNVCTSVSTTVGLEPPHARERFALWPNVAARSE